MTIKPPEIDNRDFSDLMETLKRMIPHYTPDWSGSDETDPGITLLKVFSHITESVIHRFNQVPNKSFVAFLNMLGIEHLPAQPARAPLTFTLSTGTEHEVLIPQRTQAVADKTEKHDELPFETEKPLLAIPSTLKQVIGVDPSKDAIFVPPPGFLEGSLQESSRFLYKIDSSPSAGANDFQLNHVTDLEEGDYLKLETVTANQALSQNCFCASCNRPPDEKRAEYVSIAEISGNIVKIHERLLQAYTAGTSVEKVRDFSLFEGKNLQEHCLYIGHMDFFNIKSKAVFDLEITHLTETEAVGGQLVLSWEYWGEIKGEEGEDWRQFTTFDETQGLYKNGKINLNKAYEGEIKEKTINGVKSRWVRCLVKGSLGVDRPLTMIPPLTPRNLSHPLERNQGYSTDSSLPTKKCFPRKKLRLRSTSKWNPRGL